MTTNKSKSARVCSLCETEVEVQEINGHWLVLYCDDCDRTFERSASKDITGVSVGDLRNLNDF